MQAVVIFFSVPRLEWPGDGPLFELDLNKHWGPKCGHYSVGPLLKSGLGALGQILHPPGDHKWEI